MNESFPLKIGQSVTVQDGPNTLGVKFHAVISDSRCPKQVMCYWSGEAFIQIDVSAKGNPVPNSFLLSTIPSQGKHRVVVEGYEISLITLEPWPEMDPSGNKITPNDYVATLVVKLVSSLTPTPPRTSALAECPNLSKGDAEEILGEPVKSNPVDVVLLQPTGGSLTLPGICGYGSVAFTSGKPASTNVPSVPNAVQSDHAVAAASLTGKARMEQLLGLAGVLNSANSRDNTNFYLKLTTMFEAGVWDKNLVGQLLENTRGTDKLHIEHVNGLGENAAWVWYDFSGGHYAALVAQKVETLFIIVALTGQARSEQGALVAETLAMQKVLR